MRTQAAEVVPAVALTRIEANRLMSSQYEALLSTLRELPEDAWHAVTDCDPWTVKDIVAHLIGWAEAMTSFAQFRRQLFEGRRRARELGNLLDAVNQVQVDDRASMSPQQLLERWEVVMPRFERLRRRAGVVGKALPFYEGSVIGFTNVAYLASTIYTRDAFMHRIDISRAADTELRLGRREQRLIEDVLVDWSRRTGAAARVNLEGPAGGSYLVGTGAIATIEGDAVEMARVLAGRGRISSLRLFGNVPAAEGWLEKGCPF
ncbi:MAG: maleylpyruvate isomerase family mycothiol-dependent enzyme [Actinomycetota bacterium]